MANNIKALRMSRNETQAQLADSLGVTVVAVAFRESGTRTPTVEKLVQLGKHFGCSIDEVLGIQAVNQ